MGNVPTLRIFLHHRITGRAQEGECRIVCQHETFRPEDLTEALRDQFAWHEEVSRKLVGLKLVRFTGPDDAIQRAVTMNATTFAVQYGMPKLMGQREGQSWAKKLLRHFDQLRIAVN